MATRPVTAFGRLTIPYVIDTRPHDFRVFIKEYNPGTNNFVAPSTSPTTVQSLVNQLAIGIKALTNNGQLLVFGSALVETRLPDGSYNLTTTLTPAIGTQTGLAPSTFISPATGVTFTFRSAVNKTSKYVVFGVNYFRQTKFLGIPNVGDQDQLMYSALGANVAGVNNAIVDRANSPAVRSISISYDTNDKLRRLYNQV